jgi:hypothetical protein
MEKIIIAGIAAWIFLCAGLGVANSSKKEFGVKGSVELSYPNKADHNTPVPVIPKSW